MGKKLPEYGFRYKEPGVMDFYGSPYCSFLKKLSKICKNPRYEIKENGVINEYIFDDMEQTKLKDVIKKSPKKQNVSKLKVGEEYYNIETREYVVPDAKPIKLEKKKSLCDKRKISSGFIKIEKVFSRKTDAQTTDYSLHCIPVISRGQEVKLFRKNYMAGEEPPEIKPIKITLKQVNTDLSSYDDIPMYKNYIISNKNSVVETLSRYVGIKKKCKQIFETLLLLYICHYIEEEYDPEEISADTCACNALYDIVLDTRDKSLYDKELQKSLFNSCLSDMASYNISRSADNFADLLNISPNTLLLAAYAAAAYSTPYINNALESYNAEENDSALLSKQFALHLYDDDKNSAVTVANLMLNTFAVTFRNYKNIKADDFSLCLQKGGKPNYLYPTGLFCPVMIYPDSKLSSHKKAAQSIAELAREHSVNYWPVFLSPDNAALEDCLQFGANRFDGLTNGETLKKYKEHINYVYIKYIRHLADGMINGTCHIPPDFLELESGSDDTVDMFRFLSVHIKLLTDFLRTFDCHRLCAKTDGICALWGLDKLESINNAQELNLLFFRHYLKGIFIDKTIAPEYECFSDSLTNDGPCFYLKGDSYFDDFVKRFPVTVSRREFNDILKTCGIIHYRENEAMVLKRKGINCLVVKQSVLDDLG